MWKKIILPLALAGFLVGCPSNKPDTVKVPTWDQCTKASCWNGSNAQQRMMNMLSPGMSDGKFTDYMNWMKSRGCNTAHVFTSNKADGENAGYCIYGNNWDWTVDAAYVKKMNDRISILRKNGFAVVLWLFADDSASWNKVAKANFPQHLNDLKNQKILDNASIIVVGLELNEYFNANDVAKLVSATRAVYSGKIGTHHTSKVTSFAGMGDILFYQVNPGTSINEIVNTVNSWKGRMPINMFEMERKPDTARSQAALNAEACGTGNW